MGVWSVRSLVVVLVTALLAAAFAPTAAAPSGVAGAVAASAAEAPSGMVMPSSARPGDRVMVGGADWPAGTRVQAAVCGDLAIGGSKTCHLGSAVLGRAAADGTLRLELTVVAPPRPCPCVVRISAFSAAPLAVDAPINVIGHRVGTPPVRAAEPSPRLTWGEVRVEGGDPRRWFGLGGGARLVVTLKNEGTAEAPAPRLAYRFESGGPLGTVDPQLVVPALQTRTIEIPVDVPRGMGGELEATVQVLDPTDDGAVPVSTQSTTWSTRPWGLLVVVVAGPALLLGLRWLRRRRSARQADASPVVPEPAYPLPDVVYVENLGGVLVNPSRLRPRMLRKVAARITPEGLARLTAQEGGHETSPPVADGVPIE